MDLGGCLRQTLDGAVLLDIEVTPGADRQGVQSVNKWRNRLKIAVRAHAKHGQANHAVCSVLSTQLHCALTDLTIVTGHTSRTKTVRIESVNLDQLTASLLRAVGEVNGEP